MSPHISPRQENEEVEASLVGMHIMGALRSGPPFTTGGGDFPKAFNSFTLNARIFKMSKFIFILKRR